MAHKIQFGSCFPSLGGLLGGTSTHYFAHGHAALQLTTTETLTQVPVHGNVTFSHMGLRLSGNGGTTNVHFRVDTGGGPGNGNQTLTPVGTGHFQDTTHTDTLNAGDKFDTAIEHSVGNTVRVTAWEMDMVPVNANVSHYNVYTFNGGGYANNIGNGGPFYNPLWGGSRNTSEQTTELNNANTKIRVGGTLSNMSLYVATNSSGGTRTFTAQKGATGSAGNQTIAIGTGVTGYLEDTTHTDAVSSGDIWKSKMNNIASGVATLAWVSFWFLAIRTGGFDLAAASNSQNTAVSTSARSQYGISGYCNASTTLTELQQLATFAFTARNLRCTLQTNSSGTTVTFNLWQNGAAGNLTISLTNGTTGDFEDTTHTQAITAADVLSYTHDQPNNASFFIAQAAIEGDVGFGPHRPRRISWSSL